MSSASGSRPVTAVKDKSARALDSNNLDATSRVRYDAKMLKAGGRDPYKMARNETECVKFEAGQTLPNVTYGDIYNYFVVERCYYTGEQMKAYKALDSYNYFVSGWVKEVRMKLLQDNNLLLVASVNHSQALSCTALKPWLVVKREGSVVVAHCNCLAGLGEACSHIGAVMFYMDAGMKMVETACTSHQNRWIMPTAITKVPFAEVRQMDFSSAKKKKEVFHKSGSLEPVAPRRAAGLHPSAPCEQEQRDFLNSLFDIAPDAVALVISDEHYKHFTPKPMAFPVKLSELRENATLDNEQLTLLCELVFKSHVFQLSADMVTNVEKITRDQSRSKAWFTYRAGRITASKMKSAVRTSLENPSKSLIKQICYPATTKFTSTATEHGIKNEKRARDVYAEMMKSEHPGFDCVDSGLNLNPKYPHLGASPDGLVECDCCGAGLCEVKCPFTMKDMDLDDVTSANIPKHVGMVIDENGDLDIDRTHIYYYQVQTQLFVTERDYCDFVIWSTKGTRVVRVEPDEEFWKDISEKAERFYKGVILPELISAWYTK